MQYLPAISTITVGNGSIAYLCELSQENKMNENDKRAAKNSRILFFFPRKTKIKLIIYITKKNKLKLEKDMYKKL